MKSRIISAFAVVSFTVVGVAATQPQSQVIARVGSSHMLSTTRLADILGHSTAPLDTLVARQIAELWVNYQLLSLAGSSGDTMLDPRVVQDAIWFDAANARLGKFGALLSKGWDTLAPATDEARYLAGELLAARHILIVADSTTPAALRAAKRARADSIRGMATQDNFRELVRYSEDPSAAENGGDLGVFAHGDMVKPFEDAILALRPGEISPVVETSYGYHIIYRPTFNEVAASFVPAVRQRNFKIADSLFNERMLRDYNITLAPNVVDLAKSVARNPMAFQKVNTPLATFRDGSLSASRFARWIMSYPSTQQIIPLVVHAPDTAVRSMVRRMARQEVMLRKADSAGIALDDNERASLVDGFRNDVTQTWTKLGVDPLALSAVAAANRRRTAHERIESYFDRMVKNEAPYIAISNRLATALQRRFSYTMSNAPMDRVVEQARVIRATTDSARAATAPVPGSNPSAVPTPAGLLTPPQIRTPPPGGR